MKTFLTLSHDIEQPFRAADTVSSAQRVPGFGHAGRGGGSASQIPDEPAWLLDISVETSARLSGLAGEGFYTFIPSRFPELEG